MKLQYSSTCWDFGDTFVSDDERIGILLHFSHLISSVLVICVDEFRFLIVEKR